jgi:hypothetical protein
MEARFSPDSRERSHKNALMKLAVRAFSASKKREELVLLSAESPQETLKF